MAKVGCNLGFTLQLFKESPYQNTKPELSVYDIDANGDVDAQLKVSVAALNKTWDTIVEQAEEKIISKMPIVNTDVAAQLRIQMNTFKTEMDKVLVDVNELKKQLKPMDGGK